MDVGERSRLGRREREREQALLRCRLKPFSAQTNSKKKRSSSRCTTPAVCIISASLTRPFTIKFFSRSVHKNSKMTFNSTNRTQKNFLNVYRMKKSNWERWKKGATNYHFRRDFKVPRDASFQVRAQVLSSIEIVQRTRNNLSHVGQTAKFNTIGLNIAWNHQVLQRDNEQKIFC